MSVAIDIDQCQVQLRRVVGEIFHTMLGFGVVEETPIPPEGELLAADIQFNGKCHGIMQFLCSPELATALTARILPKLPASHWEDHCSDVLAEQIGRAHV